MIAQGRIKEPSRGMGGTVPVLFVVVCRTQLEIISIPEVKMPPTGFKTHVVVEFLVRPLRIGTAPQSDGDMVVSHSIAKVGKQHYSVGYLHTAP